MGETIADILGGLKRSLHTEPYPWRERALELLGTEHPLNHFADFEAFEEWVTGELEEHGNPSGEGGDTYSCLHIYARIDLYALFCKACEFGATVGKTTKN